MKAIVVGAGIAGLVSASQLGLAGWNGHATAHLNLLARGGSLAIAGAALLGEVLGPVASPQGVSAALEAFEQRWRPVVQMAPRGQYQGTTRQKPMDSYRPTPQF